jgi:cytosine/adenosine deaminase-related metal-dependent hydrolase
VWSPFSNLWLYGQTTLVPNAIRAKVTVCLGRIGASGTKHVLGELKVAKVTSDKLGFGLTDQDLVSMITINPGMC